MPDRAGAESFLDGKVTLWVGDCLEALAGMEDNSVDSVVTDPPYHLTSIVKRFEAPDAKAPKVYETGAYGGGFDPNGKGTGAAFMRVTRGFMGKQWDGGDIAFRPETWAEVIRVLKPGGYLLAFSGTRTYHRMACAIEDAGFEVRDMVSWVYGSGFPKSHDVSKGIDKAAGVEREVIGTWKPTGTARIKGGSGYTVESAAGNYSNNETRTELNITAPATPEAAQWAGWGTALKPAIEPICMARKPLSEPTVAANVLRWGTGAINVGACRVGAEVETWPKSRNYAVSHREPGAHGVTMQTGPMPPGRWPANLIHDGSEEVVGAFPETTSGSHKAYKQNVKGWKNSCDVNTFENVGDSGSAARFFYTPKADSNDRIGSAHPTVKPVDLMQYLIRLVTPKGGTVLDPFSGTGTTGEAAWREDMLAVLIEREPEYQADIRRRMALCLAGPDERARESIKAKTKDKPVDHGPLFEEAS